MFIEIVRILSILPIKTVYQFMNLNRNEIIRAHIVWFRVASVNLILYYFIVLLGVKFHNVLRYAEV
jgi:hypothetical protein